MTNPPNRVGDHAVRTTKRLLGQVVRVWTAWRPVSGASQFGELELTTCL